MPHESKTSKERIFFPAILRKATTMCTEVRPGLYASGETHTCKCTCFCKILHVAYFSCFGCKSALQCSLNMYCMHYTCVYVLQSPGPGIEPVPTYTAPLTAQGVKCYDKPIWMLPGSK